MFGALPTDVGKKRSICFGDGFFSGGRGASDWRSCDVPVEVTTVSLFEVTRWKKGNGPVYPVEGRLQYT